MNEPKLIDGGSAIDDSGKATPKNLYRIAQKCDNKLVQYYLILAAERLKYLEANLQEHPNKEFILNFYPLVDEGDLWLKI